MTVARARILVIAAAVCAAALLAPRAAAAQPRLDVTVSGAWWDGYDLGRQRAAITGPQTPTGSPVTLFDSDVTIRSGPGAEVRIGWRVFNGVYAEATGGLGMNDHRDACPRRHRTGAGDHGVLDADADHDRRRRARRTADAAAARLGT